MPDTEKTETDQKIIAENSSSISGITQIGVQHIHQYIPCKVPLQVPLLTEDFIVPPKKEEIKNRLLNCSNSREILAITAIQGLAGIGKTTLAIILANDEEIQNRFSDGILWATLGQEPDKLSLLNSWIQSLGDYRSNYTTVQTASSHLRTLLHQKRILLVVDDAWDSTDVDPFLVGGSNCQTIITTRKAYIADDLGAKSYPLDVMTEEQSLELFKNILKDGWDKNEKEDALKVAKDVGYLPLALNLAAKRRKRDYSWVELHKALEEEIARLSILESPRRLRKGEEGLEASLNLSLKALKSFDEEAWKDFIWLGVLTEDVKINEKMASTLWDINLEEARQILEALWEEGLLIQDSTIQLGNEKIKTYRMHYLFHAISLYYLTLSPDAKKNTELPGLRLKLSEAHESLLNRYESKMQKKNLWHTLKDDAYIHGYLTLHMEKAGRIKDIHKLLREENENGKNGWYEILEFLGQNSVFIEDVIKAWNLAEKESADYIELGTKAPSIGLEIRYALINTSINSLSANIPVELFVALLETKKWTETKALLYAQKEPDPYTKVIKLISVYQKTKDESIKEEVMEKALDAASKIKDENLREKALSFIVPNLDGPKEEAMEKALGEASKIKDEYWRAKAFSSIIPNLAGQKKEEVIEKALDAASKIKDENLREKALSFIVPNLDKSEEEIMEKALSTISNINDEYWRSKAFSSIIPNFAGQKKEEVIEKALYTASKIKDKGWRAQALSFIVTNLDEPKKEEIMEKALDAASKIKDEYQRTEVLSYIVPNLDGPKKEELMEKALDTVSKVSNEGWRAQALSFIVPSLNGPKKEEIMEKALDTAFKINDEGWRAQALSSIIPNMDTSKEELMEKALNTISKINDEFWRTQALSFIVPSLDGPKKEELMKKALDAAFEINDEGWRAQALSFIVPSLDGPKKEEFMEKALDAASKIKNEKRRAEALSYIIPNLDGPKKEELMKKALDAASKIKNEKRRAEALGIILSYLKDLTIKSLYYWWRGTIQILAGRTRSDLLLDIAILMPVIYNLGEDEALLEITLAIEDVSRWWP